MGGRASLGLWSSGVKDPVCMFFLGPLSVLSVRLRLQTSGTKEGLLKKAPRTQQKKGGRASSEAAARRSASTTSDLAENLRGVGQ